MLEMLYRTQNVFIYIKTKTKKPCHPCLKTFNALFTECSPQESKGFSKSLYAAVMGSTGDNGLPVMYERGNKLV